MKSFYSLVGALDFIEDNLINPFELQDVADACYLSLSGLHRLFRLAFHTSLKTYITKRRMMLAARALKEGQSVTQLAYDMQYGSPEAFGRAFARVFNCTPSTFAKNYHFTDLYPRLRLGEKGDNMRALEVSKLYETLKELRGSYVLCVDIVGLMLINATYGIASGDIIIAETAQRIERAIGHEMMFFRVGGDEFAVVTESFDANVAYELARRVTSENGQIVNAGAHEIEHALRVGICRIPEGGLSYKDMLGKFYQSMDGARTTKEMVYLLPS